RLRRASMPRWRPRSSPSVEHAREIRARRQGQQDADANDDAARDERAGGKGERVHRALPEHRTAPGGISGGADIPVPPAASTTRAARDGGGGLRLLSWLSSSLP